MHVPTRLLLKTLLLLACASGCVATGKKATPGSASKAELEDAMAHGSHCGLEIQARPGTCAGDNARPCLEGARRLWDAEDPELRCRARAALVSACREGRLEEACAQTQDVFAPGLSLAPEGPVRLPQGVCDLEAPPEAGACAGAQGPACLQQARTLSVSPESAERCRAHAALKGACKEGGLQEACELLEREVKSPTLIGSFQPPYPLEARRHEIEGEVLFLCTINPEGAVEGCVLQKALPYVDVAMYRQLRERRFTPPVLFGQPTPVRIPYRFNLILH